MAQLLDAVVKVQNLPPPGQVDVDGFVELRGIVERGGGVVELPRRAGFDDRPDAKRSRGTRSRGGRGASLGAGRGFLERDGAGCYQTLEQRFDFFERLAGLFGDLADVGGAVDARDHEGFRWTERQPAEVRPRN